MTTINEIPKSKLAKTIDTIKTVALITIVLIVLALVLTFIIACYQLLATKPRGFVQGFAMVAVVLVPITGAVCGGVGLWLGLKQTDFIMRGVDLAVGGVIRASAEVANVRVGTYGRYRRIARGEDQGQLLPPDVFGPMVEQPILPPPTHLEE